MEVRIPQGPWWCLRQVANFVFLHEVAAPLWASGKFDKPFLFYNVDCLLCNQVIQMAGIGFLAGQCLRDSQLLALFGKLRRFAS
ncbi:hypothetical protein D3C80_1596400 [compost metagenome]